MDKQNTEHTPLAAPVGYAKEFRAVLSGPYSKLDLYNDAGAVVCSLLLNEQHLENCREEPLFMPLIGEDIMAKINRTVIINGEKRWIRANSEQEYADKLISLSGCVPAKETAKHLFSDYAKNWLETFSKPNIDSSTAISYERTLNRHILPALGNQYIEDITTADLQALFNSVGGAKTSKDKVKAVLSQIFGLALEDGIIAKNPLSSKRLKITGAKSVQTKPYSVEQMRYLIGHISSIQKAEDRAFLALLALHPLRLEEVLGLHYEDIDTEAMQIAVTHPDRNQSKVKNTKTKKSERTIGLSALALPYLGQGRPGNFIVGGDKPLSYTLVRKMCERIRQDTGFEEKVTPKRFRTTVLTDLYDQTKDVKLTQAAAGHTTSVMTMEHYVKGRGESASANAVIDRLYSA